jgi:serpin B
MIPIRIKLVNQYAMLAEEARQEISSWVLEATKGLITDLLPHGSVDADTGLMLVNAIYFKGK